MSRPTPDHGTEARYRGNGRTRPCRCTPCHRAMRHASIRRERIRAAGGSSLIDNKILAAHVANLRDSGMSQLAIARAAGVAGATISYIARGTTSTTRRDKALRILAVKPGMYDPHADQPVLGTRRRIRALYTLGHGPAVIADKAGIHVDSVVDIAYGRTNTVATRIAVGVAAAYRDLSVKPGTSLRIRRQAHAFGWHGPLAWDEIDNPDEQPDTDDVAYLTAQPKYTSAEAQHLAAEVQHLAAFGVPAHEIAARVGRSETYIRDQLRGARGPGWRQQVGEAA